jgi:hypothetical protein
VVVGFRENWSIIIYKVEDAARLPWCPFSLINILKYHHQNIIPQSEEKINSGIKCEESA